MSVFVAEPDPPTPFAYKRDPLKPVAFRQQMNSIAEIQPGQHLLIMKKFQNPQHVLVKSSDSDENEITVFKEEKGRIAETTMKFPPLERPIFEITYEKEVCQVEGADATVQKAEDAVLRAEGTSKRHSSHFVTEMKTGSPLTVDESCLLSKDVAPTSLTPITSDVALDEGDHIAVEFEENRFNHGIVLRNMGPSGVLTIPNLNGDQTIPTGFIRPTKNGPKLFRVNYEQSVPADQTKERACNVKGNRILSEKGPEYFATWARTGKPMAVNMSQLKTKKAQLRHIHPLYLERVTSPNDIHVGDHLIQGYPTHWFHFLVAAKDPSDPSKVTCIYCLRTKVAECDITLDLQDKDVYRIQYPESFAPKDAIDRARSQVGKRKFRLDARMWFVRWAKTGSDEGIEVDFLDNHSLPLTKSRIRSFAQLNVGDAIVKKEKRSFAHYYLVTEVSSPYECEAIESYYGICKTTVKFDPQNESEVFYRLNYHPGACFLPGDSVKMASHLVENYKHSHQFFDDPTRCSRHTSRCFINYVKSGERNAVDSDKLKDDRPWCIRTVKVTSIDELLPGDHIRRPVGIPLPQGCFHHMMVAKKPEENGSCSVFHFSGEKSFKKAKISQTMEKIDGNEVYRICYPERIDPNVSLQFLQRVSQYRPGEDHSIPNKPNETDDDSEAQALFQEFVDQKKVCFIILLKETIAHGTR